MADPQARPGTALLEIRRAARVALRPPLVLVACSGGADSLALLAAAVLEGRGSGVQVGCVVIDHGLQGGSARVAARTADLARGLGAGPVEIRTVSVDDGGGPEAAARTARYAALDEAAVRLGAAAVLLAHTRDDQAETVLLGLARGSGARSLSGMSPVLERGGVTYLRPLLGLARTATRAACAEAGLEPWDDPHNLDPAFTRVRVRHELLPVLERVLGPGAVEALARSAALLRDDADALDRWAAEVHAEVVGPDGAVDVARLGTSPAAIRRRVLKLAALGAGARAGGITASHLDGLDALVDRWHGQGALALPGPVVAERVCGRLTFRGR